MFADYIEFAIDACAVNDVLAIERLGMLVLFLDQPSTT
jgi:hypothetical protein